LNDFTNTDWFPVPKSEDKLGVLTEAKWFSTLDLKAVIGWWRYTLTIRKGQRSGRIEVCGNLRSCSLACATIQ
jgi:hypothetical protein